MSAPFYLAPPPAATLIGRGDIYEFVPIPWLNPPVHVLRNWQQGAAEVQQASRVRDAFRVGSRDNKEFIITECKTRFVVVFSHDAELRKGQTYVLVVPVYTVNDRADDPALLDHLRHHQIYNAFHLPPETTLRISESYADFRRLQPLHRDFLEPGKRCARLSPATMQAMLAQFSKFLLRI
ncbi:MAG: hypothetical protein WBR35_15180 [Anaerolineae bacterium]